MLLPEKIDSHWIATLDDEQLRQAESELKASFAAEEQAERKRRGGRYDLMKGPATLTQAWLRWSMVNNAARDRGVKVRYRA